MSPKLVRQRESRVGTGRWLLTGNRRSRSCCTSCQFSGTAGGLPPPLPRNISFRCVPHNPGQGYFLLFRYPFERLVEIGRKTDRRTDQRCALRLASPCSFLLHVARPFPFLFPALTTLHHGGDAKASPPYGSRQFRFGVGASPIRRRTGWRLPYYVSPFAISSGPQDWAATTLAFRIAENKRISICFCPNRVLRKRQN